MMQEKTPIIPYSEYIRICRYRVLIGDDYTDKYRGVTIDSNLILQYFEKMRKINKTLNELHVGLFEDRYETRFLAGNPSPKPGSNLWFRFLFCSDSETHWFFYKHYKSISPNAVYNCLFELINKENFGKRLLNNPESFIIRQRDDTDVRIDRRGIEMQMKYEKNGKIQI